MKSYGSYMKFFINTHIYKYYMKHLLNVENVNASTIRYTNKHKAIHKPLQESIQKLFGWHKNTYAKILWEISFACSKIPTNF